jgi:hypothetical protein
MGLLTFKHKCGKGMACILLQEILKWEELKIESEDSFYEIVSKDISLYVGNVELFELI